MTLELHAQHHQTERQTEPRVRHSSTLILLRDQKDSDQIEVLLLRRSAQSRFLPSASVFPGGGVEDSDGEYAVSQLGEERCTQSVKAWDQWGFESEQAAISSLGAALRETFEESGLPVAQLVDSSQALRCVGHWLTPAALKKRFDTYFWSAVLPSDYNPKLRVDELEIEDASWWTPKEALDAYHSGILELPVPTLMILKEFAELLGQAPSTSSSASHHLLSWLAEMPHSHPIQPILLGGEPLRLVFPGNRIYAEAAHHGEINKAPERGFWQGVDHYLLQDKITAMSGVSGSQETLKRWKRVHCSSLKMS